MVVRFRLPADTRRKIEKIQDFPVTIPYAVKRGLDLALSVVRGRIQAQRLSGRGPFPPSEHRLGIVTQQLQRSLREEPAVITGDGTVITASIGSPVFYGALHEYGWTGTVVRGQGRPYQMRIPERAPVRTGVSENASYIAGEVVDQVDKAFQEAAR